MPLAQLALIDGFTLTKAGTPIALSMGAQRLVAYLALHERPLLRLCVAGALWLDSSEERSRANLRSALWRIRRFGVVLVEVTATHLSLGRDVTVDVRAAVTTAKRILDPGRGAAEVEPDSSLLSGELLPDWYDDWVLVERERLRQLRLHALEALGIRRIEQGRYAEAIDAGLAAVGAEPLRETAQCVLVRAYLAEGNRAEAIRQYDRYRRLLATELGIEPGNELVRLIAAHARNGAVTAAMHTALDAGPSTRTVRSPARASVGGA